MEDNKSQFHRISTGLENLLEQYKTCYPRNMGQMIRHHIGKILVFTALIIPVPFVLSLSITATLFALVAFPGLLLFAVFNMFMGNDEVRKEQKEIVALGELKLHAVVDANDAARLYGQIKSMESQAAVFKNYPDVNNYLDGFDKRVDDAVAVKKQVRRNFWKFIIISLASIFAISVFLFARIFMLDETGDLDSTFDEALESVTPFDVAELLEVDSQRPLLVLKNVDSETQADFYYKDKALYVSGILIPSDGADYILSITDNDGVPVARSPRICLRADSNEACVNFSGMESHYELFRVLSYLKNKQQDLRYKIERAR